MSMVITWVQVEVGNGSLKPLFAYTGALQVVPSRAVLLWSDGK